MTDHAAVLATFDDVKAIKTRKVVQIICEAPIERYDEILAALGGYPHNPPWVAIARVDEKLAVVTAEVPAETEAPKLKGGPLSKRAGMLCNEPAFQIFAVNSAWAIKHLQRYRDIVHMTDPGRTAELLRLQCQVKSRAELDHNSEAAARFEQIEQSYYDSQRGWSEGARR